MNNGTTITIELTAEKNCKHSRRFKEVETASGVMHVGTVYIQKTSPGCLGAAGYTLTLTALS